MKKSIVTAFISIFLILFPVLLFATSKTEGAAPALMGLRIEFILFGLTLVGVALFHDKTFWVAIIGLTAILLFKLFFAEGFNLKNHFFGGHVSIFQELLHKDLREGEWSTLLNLLGLLLGFAILAKHFEESGVPDLLPSFLPHGWKGPFLLLVFIAVISSFLDNIAAAMIGGTIAYVIFNKKVHIGYIAAIVAASNAGGAGSVVGDTTTTMMWIDGVSPLNVVHAFIAAGVALLIFGWVASHQQNKLHPIIKEKKGRVKIDYGKLIIVFLILSGAILSNFLYDMPALGVWIAILIGATFRKTPWGEVPASIKGTVFLLCLVTSASLMPVNELPPASWLTAFLLGFVSAVFDNIPLTKLCLEQGCYDWGMLAYTVGFGGSMIWFGSSAGVAICNKYPNARNVVLWLKNGWHVALAYVVGFFVLLFLLGWEPEGNKAKSKEECSCSKTVMMPDKDKKTLL